MVKAQQDLDGLVEMMSTHNTGENSSRKKWPLRNKSRWNKKVVLSWVKLARTADLHARNEMKWRA